MRGSRSPGSRIPTVQALAQRLREFCAPGWVPTARLDGLLTVRVQPWWEKVGPAQETVSIPIVPATGTLPEPPPLERQARSIPDPAVTVTRPEPARDGQGGGVTWWQKTGAEPVVTGKKAEVSKTARNDGLVTLGVVSALITIILLAVGRANHASGATGLGIVTAIASVVFFITGFNPSSGKKP